MRVFLVEPDGAGGMVHYAYQLATGLGRSGDTEVTLVTGRHYELAHLPHEFRVEPRMRLWPAVGGTAARSRVASIAHGLLHRLRRVGRGLRYALEWHRLTKYLISERPDVVQFAIIRFPFQLFYLRRLRRAGIVLTQICHEFEPRERGLIARALNRRLSQAVYHCFDRIYLHGEETRSRFHTAFDVPRGRTAAISHGNESMFLDRVRSPLRDQPRFGVNPDLPVALFFGGLRPSKGIEDLIAAWSMAAAEIPGVLIVCGEPEGTDPARLRHLAEQHGVGARTVISAEYVPLEDVAAVFEMADVVVLPYRSATGSGVLQLAYTFGKPVIAANRGALAEDVVHGETGLLVEPGDSPAIARALVKILGHEAEAARMGRAARAVAREHDWDPIARGIAADYEELLR